MFDLNYWSTVASAATGTTNPTSTAKKSVDWEKVNKTIETLSKAGQSTANIINAMKGQGVDTDGRTFDQINQEAQQQLAQQQLTSTLLWVGGGIALMIVLALILKSSK